MMSGAADKSSSSSFVASGSLATSLTVVTKSSSSGSSPIAGALVGAVVGAVVGTSAGSNSLRGAVSTFSVTKLSSIDLTSW